MNKINTKCTPRAFSAGRPLGEKRILVLNYEFPPLGGGASPVSYELAKGYVKLGNEINY